HRRLFSRRERGHGGGPGSRRAAALTVTWSNDDGAPHGLVYNDGAKGTDLLLPGAAFSRTYDKPGSFDYACAVHPHMTGKVIVRAP
ncbi:MAG TPA: plastocyanin/azurin family copper-binding protein, partial [Casimicrobiaceae bacterium]